LLFEACTFFEDHPEECCGGGLQINFSADLAGLNRRKCMSRFLPTRVAERLRRLRERFGEGVREREVDHDYDHLTSTRRRHAAVRTSFLGEIWWARREALNDWRPSRERSSHLPALVTLRAEDPRQPVEMAPGKSSVPQEIDELCFRPAEPPEGLWEGTVFLLPYRRPVFRQSITGPLGALGGTNMEELAKLLSMLWRPEEEGL